MNTDYQRPPIKIALMGLGRAMFMEHYPIFKAHPTLFQVVAACDLIKARRDIVAADYPNCRMYRWLPDMLSENEIDVVLIATPSADHVEHAMTAMKHGVWVLVEPPLALTFEDAQVLRGAATKYKNHLMVVQRGLMQPDFMLAKMMSSDSRLGPVYEIKIRKEDYLRLDDWQTIKRLGGGASYYAMADLIMQALKLLPMPPYQMWSDLKRVAALGDAEDFVRVSLKTRGRVSVDIECNGGMLPGEKHPSFEVRGNYGVFTIMPGAKEGILRVIDPEYKFPRRRSSVRTPDLVDLHEEFPILEIPVELPKFSVHGLSAFWRYVYATIRTGSPFPFQLEDAIEAVKFVHLMKKSSPYGM